MSFIAVMAKLNRTLNKQHLFEILSNTINVSVSFDQFNLSLLIKNTNFFKKKNRKFRKVLILFVKFPRTLIEIETFTKKI